MAASFLFQDRVALGRAWCYNQGSVHLSTRGFLPLACHALADSYHHRMSIRRMSGTSSSTHNHTPGKHK